MDATLNIVQVFQTIAAIVTIFGVIIALFNFRLLLKNRYETHESKRRENTITLISDFSRSLTKEHQAASIILSRSPNSVVAAIAHRAATEIDSEWADEFREVIGRELHPEEIDEANKKIKVNRPEAYKIWYFATQYLNELEIICLSYHMAVVDKEMIEKQFTAYRSETYSKTATLKAFRDAINIGGNIILYDNIALFCDKPLEEPKPKVVLGGIGK